MKDKNRLLLYSTK